MLCTTLLVRCCLYSVQALCGAVICGTGRCQSGYQAGEHSSRQQPPAVGKDLRLWVQQGMVVQYSTQQDRGAVWRSPIMPTTQHAHEVVPCMPQRIHAGISTLSLQQDYLLHACWLVCKSSPILIQQVLLLMLRYQTNEF